MCIFAWLDDDSARVRKGPVSLAVALPRGSFPHIEITRTGIKVLDHIENIEDLGDLRDVPPTSHVVAVENVLRADEPRPSLPRDRALESAPDAALGGFRVPSPGAG